MNSNPYFAAKDIYQKFGAVVIVLISCWLVTFPAFAGSAPLEVKIHELELKPNAQAEWVIVPLKTGKYKLICTIPGHAEAGMVGEIAINNP